MGKILVNVIRCVIINEKIGNFFDIGDIVSEIDVDLILS